MKRIVSLRYYKKNLNGLFASSYLSTASLNDVYIAMGTNLGDKVQNLYQALAKMRKLGTVVKTGFLYKSKPMYHLSQPSFLNSVCLLRTSLSPTDLLISLKSIENEIGRQETFRNGPRIIDLDIILYNDEIIHLGENNENLRALTIPHPRMKERLFVLKPLVDIIPSDFIHPVKKKTVHQMFTELQSQQQNDDLVQVIPVRNVLTGKTRYLHLNTFLPILMGILNITPDR
jgi:dihydroneopterin aldolase/2-amino-4-hydroxy-6-hydroxymethyldihydropteridine diphosphokinase/dihydropteroate synthase